MHQLGNIALLFFDLYLAALDTAHVKNIVDQAQQMIAGRKNLLQTIPDLLFVVDMVDGDGGKADDRIHRCADIVGHVGKESALGLVGMLRLHQGILQCLRLLLLFPHLLGDLFRDYHYHDFIRIVSPRHDKGLTDAHRMVGISLSPVIYVNLGVAFFEAMPQIFQVYHSSVFF